MESRFIGIRTDKIAAWTSSPKAIMDLSYRYNLDDCRIRYAAVGRYANAKQINYFKRIYLLICFTG